MVNGEGKSKMSAAANEARKIVEKFEDIFGDLSATESDWLYREIANAIQIERNKIPRIPVSELS